ncbi:MAG: SulP family inorganic anion transporter [Burkholderiales bacterium]
MAGAQARSLGNDVRSGIASAFVSLGILLPLGVLALSPLGVDAGPEGVRAAFVAAIVGGLVAVAVGGVEHHGNGPKTSTTLIFAGFVATLMADPRLRGSGGAGLEAILLLGAACVVLAGVLQVLFAALRLGSAASFVPRPVVAGFMDGIALLIVVSQFEALLGVAHSGAGRWAPVAPTGFTFGALGIGLAVAALCWFIARRWPRVPWAVIGIVVGTALYLACSVFLPRSMLGGQLGAPDTSFTPPVVLALRGFPDLGALVAVHATTIVTTAVVLALIGSLDALLSAVAVDTRLNTRHDSNRLLLGLGLGNIVCGCAGGLPVVTSSAVQLAGAHGGGRGRRVGVVCAAMLLAVALVVGPLLAYVPVAATAGVMLIVALGLLDQWSKSLRAQLRGGSRDRDAVFNLAIAATVCAITIAFGFVVGIVVGLVLAAALFVHEMNRSLVRSVASLATRGSRRIWPAAAAAALRERGEAVRIVELEGAVFFGTAHRCERDLARRTGDARCLIVDVRRVSMIDASGAFVLERLATQLKRRGARMVLAGLTPYDRRARALRAYGVAQLHEDTWYPDTDHALEDAERALLAEAGIAIAAEELPPSALSLLEGMDDAQCAAMLRYLARVELAAGEILFHRGEPGDRLYVLAKGSVSILADMTAGVARAHRLASFAPGVIFGETAMLDGGGRSAGAAADEPSVVYVLTRESLDTIRAQEPALASVVLLNVARQVSARLRFATGALQAAERT